MLISKWGNSLAVRLPKALVEELGLKEGDEIELRRTPDGALEIARKQTLDELFERVGELPEKLPADFKFNREEAHRRGRRDSE